jgi:preprotein translocase subunit SecA
MNILTRLLGSRNDRLLRRYRKTVQQINSLEATYEAKTDDELRAQTQALKQQVAQGSTLEQVLPHAFALVREASKRVLQMRHFDVQLLGGLALHEGKIAEMRTGEGKTLTSTLPIYLNALRGHGVHLVTVNDYLAARDAAWMGRIYEFLGMTVGVNLPDLDRSQKQAAYACDITYGTNNEFGFDYLRDNMVYAATDRVQRPLHYAIVDEVDSILIDEARTPLIISGQAEDHTATYVAVNAVVPSLVRQEGEADPRTGEGVIKPGDFTVDEKARQVYLTEQGHEHAEQLLAKAGLLPEGASLYDASHITLMHHVLAALRAHNLYLRDQHYVVQNNEVVIVDEFTGRLMAARRWSDGLHQAVEAKEAVSIQAENQTMASITFQNYFRLYNKLAGMTGTADTEAYEFQQIYSLETVVIPPNKPNRRKDELDRVYKTTPEKYQAAIEDIRACHERGQPVLVGTSSIENSEIIAQLLTQAKLPHEVLNAKQHAREADIIAQAGRLGSITIATNMAGRGTDIVLGGNLEKWLLQAGIDAAQPQAADAAKRDELKAAWDKEHQQVVELGGLRIIATERHESRRIDNQLRGRSGRQGDPGSSRFYLSLDDPLMRIFAGDRVRAIMDRLKMPEGEAIEAGMVTRSIESAQRKVEARNFDIRKQLLEYDDVSNDQRKVIYTQRNDILEAEMLREQVDALRHGSVQAIVALHVPPDSVEEQWDLPTLSQALQGEWGVSLDVAARVAESSEMDAEEVLALVTDAVDTQFNDKLQQIGEENFSQFERMVLLQVLDSHWREHLSALDHLRQGIHLRGYAQKQPKQEYKREAFELFGRMLDQVRDEVTRILLTVQIAQPEQASEAAQAIEAQGSGMQHVMASGPDESGNPVAQPASGWVMQQEVERVGRNQPCPCGSGKKYKHCHGALS